MNCDHIDHAYSLKPPSDDDVRKLLFDLGHFHVADEDNFVEEKVSEERVAKYDVGCHEYRAAVGSYQRMRPLAVDGRFGPCCHHQALAEVGHRCGCPDIMERRASLSEWPESCQKLVTTAHEIESLSLSGDRSINETWEHGVTRWNEVCGVVLSHVESMSDARIRATASRMSGSTLAWSYLPNNNCSEVLAQRYNTRVSWSFRYLWTTITHEIGHAIGLSHGGHGIMKPYNDNSTVALGSWDIAQAVKRYGKRTDVPDPPPDDPPTPKPGRRWAITKAYKLMYGKPVVVEEWESHPRPEVGG